MTHSRRPLTRALGAACAAVTAAALATALPAPAQAGNPPTPGGFRGYGFDQCVTPSQTAMNRWMTRSPFQAVGIYISGASRGCRDQPNLTPTWVANQQANGWKLLPITVGPQAACNPAFPRYGNDPKIKSNPDNNYAAAREQGRIEARRAANAASGLGIAAKSTLWYDIEHFDISKNRCRISAIAFLQAWTYELRKRGYVSGVYSSASSGIKMLDDARVDPDNTWGLPDRIWLARWDGKANVYSDYIRNDGWLPGNRMKQYRGGHEETHGGVTINIDSNWIVLGNATGPAREPKRCGGINLNFGAYRTIKPGSRRGDQVRALKCYLQRRHLYNGPLGESYNRKLKRAIHRYQRNNGVKITDAWTVRNWVRLVSAGKPIVLKPGSNHAAVRRLQRGLNAAGHYGIAINGKYRNQTRKAVRSYQKRVGLPVTGYATLPIWDELQTGQR